MDLKKKYKQLFEGKVRSNDNTLLNEAYEMDDITAMHDQTKGDSTPMGAEIWKNKPLRNLIERYVDNNSPNGAKAAFNMAGGIPMKFILKYVTQEEPGYKKIADSIDDIRQFAQGMQAHVNGEIK